MSNKSCDIEQKKCERSKKDDIKNLAISCCGPNYSTINEKGKEKTVKELCQDIINAESKRIELAAIKEAGVEIVIEDEEEVGKTEADESESEEVVLPTYTRNELEGNTKSDLLVIAKSLGLEKYNNKLLKNQNKDVIIEAILSSSGGELADIVIEEEEEIVPEYTSEKLNKNTIPELKKIAKEYNVLLKSGLKKKEIIEAILKKLRETRQVVQMPSIVEVPISPEPVPSEIPPLATDYSNILQQIHDKRLELLKKLQEKQNIECDPKGDPCADDYFCDISKTPNICVPPEEAKYRVDKNKAKSLVYNGKKLVGTPGSIDNFRRMVEEGRGEYKMSDYFTPPPSPVFEPRKQLKDIVCKICGFNGNSPDDKYCIACTLPLSEGELSSLFPKEEVEIIEQDMVPEGTEITDARNIEEILNDIQRSEGTSFLTNLDEAKRKVLNCIGLLN
jgi:Rho termination factor, N-terminal domain